MLGSGRNKAARVTGLSTIASVSILLSQCACADEIPALADAGFRTFAVEDLDLRTPLTGGSDIITTTDESTIPGYPLSAEELNLVMGIPQSVAGFDEVSVGLDYADEQFPQPFQHRLMGWFKQRSSDFNLFKLFDSDDSRSGVRLDVDTEEEELVLQYRIGF